MNPFQIIGAVGLLLISSGLLLKNRRHQNILYILGGLSLETYSIHIGDAIFISLQAIFTLFAVYDLIRLRFRAH